MKSLKRNILRERSKKNGSHTQTKGCRVFHKQKGGFIKLERLWREHFLTVMKPKYLPELWSVCHNEERLSIRQDQNRIEPSDAKVAGINN